jgi:6-phosphogluconolactonase (cycloisomerase 2 family)
MKVASTLTLAGAAHAAPGARIGHSARQLLRLTAGMLLLGLMGLLSACGSSSNSFVSISTGPAGGATLTSISVEPANSSLPRGLSLQYTAMAIYSNGTKLDVTSSVTWSSSAANIATINATGVANAVNLGTTTISAAIGAVTGTATLTVTAATLVTIDVTPVSPTIAKGATLQLTATGIYTDYSTQNLTALVTWSSSNVQVATVSNAPNTQGLATGVGGGTATLTAALGAASGSTVLTVSGATLTSLAITPANPSIAKGRQQQFTVTATYSDGTQQNLTTTATWTATGTATTGTGAVATISNTAGSQGLATGTAVGTSTITAAAGGLTASTTLTVTAATLVSITVTPANASIPVGVTQAFIATGTYTDGSTAVVTPAAVWNSATPAVATITNAPAAAGIATGVAQGTTFITAAVGAVTSAPVTLTVTPAALVSITVTPANPTIVNGATLQFTATGTYTDNTTMVITTLVTWTPANPVIATISNAAGNQGDATAASAGTTLITATYPGTNISGSTTLTVRNAYAYATNTAAPGVLGSISQYAVGLNGQLTALAPPTVPAGYNPFSIAINPAGTYAYVANYNKTTTPANSTIFTYQISQTTGALTQIGSVVTASNPNSVTIDPSGSYVYVSNNSETDVSEFVIQPNGTLANPMGVVGVGGAIFPSGAGPSSIAINPADTFAYVANYNDGTVSQYVIGRGGALAVIPNEPATINTQAGPSYVIVDPSGRYVYVANQGSGSISEYAIGADGALAPIGAGVTPYSAMTIGQSFLAINAAGTFLYAADSNSENVAQYSIAAGGANPGLLTLVATYTTGAGTAPYGLTIDATGKWLYVAERITAGAIAQFAIGQMDGTLTPLPAPAPNNTAPAGAAPTSIATTP